MSLREILPVEAMLSETWIGPVGPAMFSVQPSWQSDASNLGLVQLTLSANVELRQGEQLSELVSNRDLRVTVLTKDGTLVFVWFGAAAARRWMGWYLLDSIDFPPLHPGDDVPFVPVQINGWFLGGDRNPVVVSGSNSIENDFGLDGVSILASPFDDEDPLGGRFVVDPAPARFSREYDASSPHVTARLEPDSADDRRMTIYVGDA